MNTRTTAPSNVDKIASQDSLIEALLAAVVPALPGWVRTVNAGGLMWNGNVEFVKANGMKKAQIVVFFSLNDTLPKMVSRTEIVGFTSTYCPIEGRYFAEDEDVFNRRFTSLASAERTLGGVIGN